MLGHSHKKQKDSLETQAVLLIFSLGLIISGAGLTTFCCYDHGFIVSEAVQKITTDQKEYCKCSLCVMIWWMAKIYPSVSGSEKWLVAMYKNTIEVAKKAAEVG